jgi:tungstate transport system ATP-binding protein
VILYELKGLRQVFGRRTVLDIDHLTLPSGSSHVLLGPNGCGKTTLLRILAFLRPPTAGKVLFRGHVIDWSEKTLLPLRRQVVLVDQHPIMFTTTVLKNVEYGPKMRGVPAAKRRRIAMECLERVGMKEFAQRPAHLLSGGENQRVAIARALSCSPAVMLFDEPTASVDIENQSVIEAVIRDIRTNQGITVIFSTHKHLEATRLANNKIFMLEGKPVGAGGENLFSGDIVERNGRTVCVIGNKAEFEVDSNHRGRCRVFIKPENISIYKPAREENLPDGRLISGTVLQMTAEGDFIRVLLDIDVPVRAIMTRDKAVESGMFVGDRVKVGFAPGTVRLEP